jgi:hypothetical protein
MHVHVIRKLPWPLRPPLRLPLALPSLREVSEFKRRREVELKHGRISMFATIGYIWPEYARLPGYLSPSYGIKFADIPNGLGALSKVPAVGVLQFVAFIGLIEVNVYNENVNDEPGNYGAGFLALNSIGFVRTSPSDAETRKKKLNAELANGRLAMVAIIGMFYQDGLTGSAWGDWSLYTDSPLRAGPKCIEGLGGPFPEDYWDPAGLAVGKSEEQLIHWRNVEIKHGRVAMLACLGWFHVAAGWHPIGDYAAGVRLSNDPLVNVTQLSMGGAWQVIFTILCFEWMFTYVTPPPKGQPWDLLGWDKILAEEDMDGVNWYEDWDNIRLQEINNGRLAMFGILGLIGQDLAGGGYFEGIGQICFGSKICENWEEWDFFFPFPRAPYNPPALYPGGKPPLVLDGNLLGPFP